MLWSATPVRRRSRLVALGVGSLMALALGTGPALAQAPPVPSGYRVVADRVIAKGVEHVVLTRTGPSAKIAAQRVHVARISTKAPYALRPVAAHNDVSGGSGRERTSSICRRVKCLLAVNGDFWTPETGQLIGGVVSDGRLIKSPNAHHSQLVVSRDGKLVAGRLGWKGTLVSTDFRSSSLAGVNVAPIRNGIVLYTPAFGNRTRTGAGTTELVMKMVRPRDATTLARTSVVRISHLFRGKGNTPIRPGSVVLSANGVAGNKLLDLWQRIQRGTASRDVLLRFESTPAAIQSVGGSPMLVRNGRIIAPTDNSSFTSGRHPRTIVGRTKNGGALLVTIDGRQPGYSEGMTLANAAQLMIDLGAVDAINLDGGGSTTFVRKGAVVNRPSDRIVRVGGRERILTLSPPGLVVLGQVERPVAVALALVPRGAAKDKGGTTTTDPQVLLDDMDLPKTVALPVPQGVDPASDPTGSLAALTYVPVRERSPLLPIAASLVVVGFVIVAMLDPKFRRRLVAFARAE